MTKITKSKYLGEIHQMFADGVPSLKISKWLKNKGEDISQPALSAYRRKMRKKIKEKAKTILSKEAKAIVNTTKVLSNMVKLTGNLIDKSTKKNVKVSKKIYLRDLMNIQLQATKLLTELQGELPAQQIVIKWEEDGKARKK